MMEHDSTAVVCRPVNGPRRGSKNWRAELILLRLRKCLCGLQTVLLRLWETRPLLFTCLLALSVRLAWFGVAQLGVPHHFDGSRFPHQTATGLGYQFSPVQAVDMWTRWDAFFYVTIAQEGYGSVLENLRAAFFPLYPLVCRAVASLTGLRMPTAALCVANGADLLGWCLFAKLTRQRLPLRPALWALLAFAAFPTRNFGFSAYSEGLFLALSVGAFLAFEQRRWGLLALCLALVSVARPLGIGVGMALGAQVLWHLLRGGRRPAPHTPTARPPWGLWAALGAAPLGLLAYMGFLWRRFANPLAFAAVQKTWKRQVSWPTQTLLAHGEPLNHVALWGALGLGAAMLRAQAPLRDSFYVLFSVAVPLLSGSVTSMPRFVGMLFPLFLFIGQAATPRQRRGYLVVAVIWSGIMAFKVGQGGRVI
jgi:hypothetical protein